MADVVVLGAETASTIDGLSQNNQSSGGTGSQALQQLQHADHLDANATMADASTAGLGESASVIPVKRRPGRPKGSGKKQRLQTVAAEGKVAAEPFASGAGISANGAGQNDNASEGGYVKVKRPVGRPRKDGLPAGSLLPPKDKRLPGRPRKSAPASLEANSFASVSVYSSSANFHLK